MMKLEKLLKMLQLCGHYTKYSDNALFEEEWRYDKRIYLGFQGSVGYLERIKKNIITARILCGCKSASKLPDNFEEKFMIALNSMIADEKNGTFACYATPANCYFTAINRMLAGF